MAIWLFRNIRNSMIIHYNSLLDQCNSSNFVANFGDMMGYGFHGYTIWLFNIAMEAMAHRKS